MTPATELWAHSAEELRAGCATRAFSPPEVIDVVARRIEREQLRAGFGQLLGDGAFLVTPVAAEQPVTIASERARDRSGARFRSQVLPYTTPHDLVGFPSCAVRCGFDSRGLPVGLQVSASPWRDWEVIDLVEALWDATADVQARWPGV